LALVSLAEFVAELEEIARSLSATLGEKTDGFATASRSESVGEPAHLFVLGMLEGVFPRRRTEDPVLSDFERDQIAALRLGEPFLPDSHQRARAERDEFVALCASAKESVTFSYPLAGEDRDNVPAFYLQEAKRARGTGWMEAARSRKDLAPPGSALAADRRLADALSAPKERPSPSRLESGQSLAALAPSVEFRVSPNELHDAALCPFRYVFGRRLELRGEDAREPLSRLRRLPQAAELTATESREQALAQLRAMLEVEVEALRSEIPPGELKLLRAAGERQIRDWVEREFLAREVWPKDSGSVKPHAAFDQPGLAGELPLKGKTVKLKGAVTSVCSMGNYSVAQLANARSSLVETNAEKLSDADKLELGVILWALSGTKPGTAVEVGSMGGRRTLFVLPRFQEQPLDSRQGEGLRVVAFDDKRAFFTEVKELLSSAIERIDRVDVEAVPGDQCTFCDLGELCRNSKDFGEDSVEAETEEPEDG
jgi:hypothetical protein